MLKSLRLIVLGLIVAVNWVIIGLLLSLLGLPDYTAAWGAAVIEAVLVGLAFTPMGETYFRFTNKLRCLSPEEERAIRPAFESVCRRCGITNPPELFMQQNAVPNAMAVGTNTVAVTTGLMSIPEGELQAVFAHELGHLVNGDTKIGLVVYVANLAGAVATWAITILIGALALFGMGSEAGERNVVGVGLAILACAWMLRAVAWVLQKLLDLSFLAVSRTDEYAADAYAAKHGYQDNLIRFLTRVEGTEPTRGLIAGLCASHPAVRARIERLERGVGAFA